MQGNVMSFCSLMTPAGRKLCTASTVRGHQLGIPFSELQRRGAELSCVFYGWALLGCTRPAETDCDCEAEKKCVV